MISSAPHPPSLAPSPLVPDVGFFVRCCAFFLPLLPFFFGAIARRPPQGAGGLPGAGRGRGELPPARQTAGPGGPGARGAAPAAPGDPGTSAAVPGGRRRPRGPEVTSGLTAAAPR